MLRPICPPELYWYALLWVEESKENADRLVEFLRFSRWEKNPLNARDIAKRLPP